jgi:hypothetical protein
MDPVFPPADLDLEESGFDPEPAMTRGATRSGWAAAAFLTPAILGTAVALAMAVSLRPLLMTNVGIVVLAVFLLFLIGVAIFRSRRDLLAMPVVFSFAYLGYPLGAIFYVLGWDPPFEDVPTFVRLGENRGYLLLAILLAFGGYLAIWGGYHLGLISRKPAEADASSARAETEVLRTRLHLTVAVFFLMGLAAVAVIIQQRGGIASFIQTQSLSRTAAAGSFYLTEIALLLPLASILWLAVDFRRAKKSLLFWVILIFGLVYLLFTLTRWNIIDFVFVLTALFYLNGALTKKRMIVLLGILLAVVVIVGRARQISSRGEAISVTTIAEFGRGNLDARSLLYLTVAGRNFTDIDVMAFILNSYSWADLEWGKTFAEIPLMVVPRAFWGSKPTELGAAVFQKYSGWDEAATSWHPGFLGELYINFHVLGTLAGLIFLGFLLAKADRWRMADPSNPSRQLPYTILAVVFVLKGIITGFMLPTIQALMYLLPVWVALKIVVRRGRPGSLSGASVDAPALGSRRRTTGNL